MSSTSDLISHKGLIVEISPEFTTVEIISEAACSSCHAKALCGLGESKKKAIQVPTRGWDNYVVGQEVEVQLKASMGHKAVWLAYVLPLIILVAALLLLSVAGIPELYAGLGALLVMGLYYFVIWCFRSKLKNEYIFNIK